MCLKVVSRTSNQKSHFWHVTNVQKNFDAILGEGSKIPRNIISVRWKTNFEKNDDFLHDDTKVCVILV